MEEILKTLTVYLLSAIKFIFGPTLGISYGFSVVATALLTTLGMMTTVYSLSYFEKQIHGAVAFFFETKKPRKVFTRRNRRFVKIWRTYGLKGVAFLTPVILTPIGGTLLANAVGGRKNEIIRWMWISAAFWSITITALLKFGKSTIETIL